MVASQNGWPVVKPDKINNSPINGHKYPNGFLAGDVFSAFVWLFTQLNDRVEKVALDNPPDEWGYYVKVIEGSKTISNHASGTAGDYNASKHPMGTANTWTGKQQKEIDKILAESNHIFRCGKDYTGRKDDMHFEVIAHSDAVHTFVESLKAKKRFIVDISLNGYGIPSLIVGDDDSKMAGYDYVHRAQMDLNYVVNAKLKVDGVYGPKMVEAVAKLPTPGDGTVIDIDEWEHLYGLVKTAAK